jgi:phospholipid-translocating ATPase
MASVLVANLFVGLDIRAWNWWIFVGVWLGPVLIFVFAPIYAAFPPTVIWTYSYGNNHYLYDSAAYWFSGIMVVTLSLTPKIIWRHVRSIYFPTDIEIIRQVEKYDPTHDFVRDPAMPAQRAAQKYGVNVAGEDVEQARQQQEEEQHPIYPMSPLHQVTSRASSMQHDMLTGSRTPVRGYSFSAEDEPYRGPKARRRNTLTKRLLPSGLRNTLSRRNKRLSAIRNSDAGHDDEGQDTAVPSSATAHEFGQIDEDTTTEVRTTKDEPGPEDDDEDEDDESPLQAVQHHVEDAILPSTRGQMNGEMSTNQ